MNEANVFELFKGQYRWTCTLKLTDEIKQQIEKSQMLSNGLYKLEDLSPLALNDPLKIILLGIGKTKGSSYAVELQ